jgi:hypothetical protein
LVTIDVPHGTLAVVFDATAQPAAVTPVPPLNVTPVPLLLSAMMHPGKPDFSSA